MNAIKIKKYRGANILIINEWQDFIAIIFYRGGFYHCRLGVEKNEVIFRNHKRIGPADYTNGEYLVAVDTIVKDAKILVDNIIKERSLWNQIKKIYGRFKVSV